MNPKFEEFVWKEELLEDHTRPQWKNNFVSHPCLVGLAMMHFSMKGASASFVGVGVWLKNAWRWRQDIVFPTESVEMEYNRSYNRVRLEPLPLDPSYTKPATGRIRRHLVGNGRS